MYKYEKPELEVKEFDTEEIMISIGGGDDSSIEFGELI